MTYHKDGSFVKYGNGKANALAKNCGWLSIHRKWAKGNNQTSDVILNYIADKSQSAMTCGHHKCEICDWEDGNYGNGEIWIKINDGYWRMPRMLWHYTKEHEYKLPEEVDVAISQKSYKLIDFHFASREINEVFVDYPRYEVIADWSESKFSDLIDFNRKTADAGWRFGETWVRDGKYTGKLGSYCLHEMEYLIEDGPDIFPDNISIKKY